MLRQIEPEAKLSDMEVLAALETVVSQAQIDAVVARHGVAEQRCRKLPANLMVMLVIAMNLFTQDSLAQVLLKLLKGLRFIWPDPTFSSATKGAISQRRYQLGAQPLAALFHQVCRALATEATVGAFVGGLRVMAIDGTKQNVADTPANARAFGRPKSQHGDGAFPQLQLIFLTECGSHAIVDVGIWPGARGEVLGALRLLRSVSQGMRLIWDRGFHRFELARRTRQRAAHFLGRVPAQAQLKALQRLGDGSYLAYLYPSDRQRRQRGEHVLVRVIEYTLTDPQRVGYGETHRLMTSLLDDSATSGVELAGTFHAELDQRLPQPTPVAALDLTCTYHQRWEAELTIDEFDTHQRLGQRPLRSLKPVGVIQELYGLLIAHYAVRALMHAAALQVKLDPDRLSFINALRLICDAVSEFQMVPPQPYLPLYQRLLRDIARFRLPPRANRINPRVVKRPQSKFKVKRPEHRHPLQPAKPFRDVVRILI